MRIRPAGASIEGTVEPECERTRDRLSDLLDGELSEPSLRRVARHLGGCPECAPIFASLVRAVGALRSLSRLEAPAAASALPAVLERVAVTPPRRRAIDLCLERASLRRTLTIALVAGMILTSVSQGDVLLAGAGTWLTALKIVMNFVVAFVVSNLGLLAAASSGRIAR